jgi:hypothetical protein
VTTPIAVIGGGACFGGIILGNLAISRIVYSAQKTKSEAPHEMFSSIGIVDPPSPRARRQEALRMYKQSQPNGPLIKQLRVGQSLVVIGSLVMLVGAFI